MEEMDVREEGMEVDCSDTDSSADENEILEKRAKELESQLSAYVYSYDAHVELVGIYKKLLNLTDMREAYERFSKHFPLTGTLWLDWIRDEMRVASTDNEKKYIISLFDKAVDDYLSIDLWLEYVQFSIGQNDVETTRKIFERATNAAGLHVSKGSLIWDAYREFELAHLSLITDSECDAWQQQAIKVSEIFRRQLSVPLMDMERTFVEWRVWVERLPHQEFIDKDQVGWTYKKATKYLDDCLDFEEDLLVAQSDAERLKIYREYIEDERKPENIRCLYERAVSEVCLDHELWYDYCLYFFKLGNYDAALKTSERALRNCPWSDDLWMFNMRVLEILGKSHDDVTQCLEKALGAGFQNGHQYLQLWLTYLEHYRRITDPNNTEAVEKLREAFNRGHQHLAENFGIDADPECTFLRFWAKIEASFLKDVIAARKIWNEYGILKTLGSSANIWLELIGLEQQYGDEKHVRKTYQRALSSTKDWPQCIVQSWLMYEREYGSVESVMSCTDICRKHMKKHHLEHPVQQQENTNGNRNETEQNKHQSKKRKFQEQKHTNANEKKLKQVKISDDVSKKNRNSVEQHNKEEQRQELKKEDKDKRIDIDNEKQLRSVFISNLDYIVTDDELKTFLGPVEELRLVKDRKGHSKGYAYCVFSTQEEALKTMARDRELLKGRPVFISECKVDRMQRETQFKYCTTQEKHKLFVKGLPLSMSQEEVEALFRVHGDIKEVRLVTYRNGRPKGLAYVEFKDANDAAKAIIATDNTEIKGFTISVAISDPPKRKTEAEPVSELARHSKSRLQIPLVPRVVQSVAAKQTQPKMTNEDFRKMLSK